MAAAKALLPREEEVETCSGSEILPPLFRFWEVLVSSARDRARSTIVSNIGIKASGATGWVSSPKLWSQRQVWGKVSAADRFVSGRHKNPTQSMIEMQ